MSSKELNSNWIIRADWDDLHCLIGYASLLTLLGDTAPRVFDRLEKCKSNKLIVRPFHGRTITFYAR